MENIQTYEAAAEIDAFDTPLLGLRVVTKADVAVIDLIPSMASTKTIEKKRDPSVRRTVAEILASGTPIEEAMRFMRVHFSFVQALVIQREFVEIVDILDAKLDSAPRRPGSRSPYPFLRVINSAWKRRLPDYQGGNDPKLTHFTIGSLETHVDILGIIEKIEWLDRK